MAQSYRLRRAEDVARRAVILNCLVATTFKVPHDRLIEWLQSEDLWGYVTPWESDYFQSDTPTDDDRVSANRSGEALATLLWAMTRLDELPEPLEPTSIQAVVAAVPKLFTPTNDFITGASLRPADEVYRFNEEVYEQNWAVRDAWLNNRPIPNDYHPEVVNQRHRALNWLCADYSEDVGWDDITTDT